MTQLTDPAYAVAPIQQRRNLARITGAAGLVTLVVVLGTSLANDYQSAAFDSDAGETVDVLPVARRHVRSNQLVRHRGRTDRDAVVHPRPRPAAAPLRGRAAVALGLPRRCRCRQRRLRADRELGRRGVPLRRHRPPGRALRLRPRQPVLRERLGRRRRRRDLHRPHRARRPATSRTGSAGGPSSRASAPCWREPSGPRTTRSIPFTAFWIWVAVLSVALLLGRFAVAGCRR